ncbi:MAG: amylo-alpha-1,6-glucosidase [Candidatus Parvarchaeum sp.]
MEPIIHVLSKNGMFLFRFNNGEFGSKWCGVWKGSQKYFDYFAFKLGEEFLSEANFKKFSFYNSQFSTLLFETSQGRVIEEVKCYDDSILVSVTPSFDSMITCEVGINIRKRDENYEKGKRYGLTEIKNGIKAEFNGKAAYVYFPNGKFEKEEYYGIHSPGLYALKRGLTHYLDNGEVQNKYVPGNITCEVKANETFDILFSSKDMEFDSIYKLIKNKIKYAEEYGEIIKSESKKFDADVIDKEFVMDSIDSIYSYANFNDKEFYAGFPYFNEFWLRDALIVLPSFLSMGNFSFVRDLLLKIAYRIDDKGLPNTMNGSLYPKDVLGLFLIDLYEYFKYTADTSLIDIIADKKEAIMKISNEWIDNGFIHDKGNETWMDSISREYSVEIQAIWAKAMSAFYSLFKDEKAKEVADTLKKSLNSLFKENYLMDQKDKDINSANQIFALYFDVVDKDKKDKIIKNIEDNMLSEYGILSVSKNDKTFEFNGYQTGAVWPFLTEMFAAVAFENGKKELGKTLFSILKEKNDNAQCSSRINEIFRPDGSPKGCPSQAWSIGLIPFITERYILGIEPDIPSGEITIKKRDGIKAKKDLNLGGKRIELEINDGRVKSNYGLLELSDRLILEL